MIKIDGYLIDGAVSEKESLSSTATKYPVESGATISDHVVNDQPTLDIEFVVSDTPIGAVLAARGAGVVPSSEARTVLTTLRASKRPFKVESGGRVYESMVFTSLEFPKDGATGDCLRGTATLDHIQIANVRRVSVSFGQRSARHVKGVNLWLCPAGVPVDNSDAVNQRHGCARVTRDSFGNLVYSDLPRGQANSQLTDAEVTRLLGQNAASLARPGLDKLPKVPTGETTFNLQDFILPDDFEPPANPTGPTGPIGPVGPVGPTIPRGF